MFYWNFFCPFSCWLSLRKQIEDTFQWKHLNLMVHRIHPPGILYTETNEVLLLSEWPKQNRKTAY